MAGIALVVGGAIYYFSNKGQKETIGDEIRPPTGNALATSGNTHSTNMTNGLGRELRVPQGQDLSINNSIVQLKEITRKERDMYSKKTLILINQLIEDLCIDEFGEIFNRNRTLRRKVRTSDSRRYAQIVEQELVETDQLVIDTLNNILQQVEGDFEIYKNSIEYWSQQDQTFALMNMMMIEKMKISAKTNRDRSRLTADIAKSMIRYQIQIYPTIETENDNPELDMLVKKSIVQDMVFEKFGFEEEDMVTLPQLGQDPEFGKLAQQLQMIIQMDQMKAMQGMGMMPF